MNIFIAVGQFNMILADKQGHKGQNFHLTLVINLKFRYRILVLTGVLIL